MNVLKCTLKISGLVVVWYFGYVFAVKLGDVSPFWFEAFTSAGTLLTSVTCGSSQEEL